MADGDARTTQRRRSEPAGPRTLRAWRRIGLVLGPLAAVLLVGSVVAVLLDRDTVVSPLAGAGLLCAAGAVVFLDRVWAEPLHPRTRLTVVGARLAAAFWGLWSLGVFLDVLRVVFEVDVPIVIDAGIGLLVVTVFLGVLVVGVRVPAVHGA